MEKKKIRRKEEDVEKPQNPLAGSGAFCSKRGFTSSIDWYTRAELAVS